MVIGQAFRATIVLFTRAFALCFTDFSKGPSVYSCRSLSSHHVDCVCKHGKREHASSRRRWCQRPRSASTGACKPSRASDRLSDPSSFLRAPTTNKHHQPIFLQVCHSPWRVISQNVLCYIRGLVLLYLFGAGLLIANFQLSQADEHGTTEHNVARIVFAFPTVTYALVLLYNAIAFVSAAMVGSRLVAMFDVAHVGLPCSHGHSFISTSVTCTRRDSPSRHFYFAGCRHRKTWPTRTAATTLAFSTPSPTASHS